MFCHITCAQCIHDTLINIDKIIAHYGSNIPGFQIAISRDGNVIYSKAVGIANLEYGIPITKETVIEAGSVSKQITAAAVLLLEQQGKLSLKDNIRKFLPELSQFSTPVTISDLIYQTSGLHDWTDIAEIGGLPNSIRNYSNDDVLFITSRQKRLNFAPDSAYLYSNTNYVLLAIIVKRVSGKSLADYTGEQIFKPAGMTHTQWRSSAHKIVTNRAVAYSLTKDGYRSDMPIEDSYGAGGLLTTAEDLLKWNQYYLSGKFGNPSLLKKQISGPKLSSGETNVYAAGLFVGENKGWRFISHGGATASYRAKLESFPELNLSELNLSIAWLSNTSQFDTARINLISEIEKHLVPVRNSSVNADKIPIINLAYTRLKNLAGLYNSGQVNQPTEILLKDGKLNVFDTDLKPVSATKFMLAKYVFDFNKSDQLTVTPPNSDQILFYKSAAASLTFNDSHLKDFEGNFQSNETQSSFSVAIKKGRLVLVKASANSFPLISITKDIFAIDGMLADLHFIRNKRGQVSGLAINMQRSLNIEFVKYGQR